jgi:hypothetical protein
MAPVASEICEAVQADGSLVLRRGRHEAKAVNVAAADDALGPPPVVGYARANV